MLPKEEVKKEMEETLDNTDFNNIDPSKRE